MIAELGMAQLLVRDIPDSLVKKLKRRAVERGVSAEEEHRRILRSALQENAPWDAPDYTLRDHILSLAEVAPDIDFSKKPARAKRRPIQF